jgi:hypothetical protein
MNDKDLETPELPEEIAADDLPEAEDDLLELEETEEFNVETVTSSAAPKPETPARYESTETEKPKNEFDEEPLEIDPFEGKSPAFIELAQPKLPALAEDNRAFLQIQSPNRIFFYWSVKTDSFETLRRALGNRAASYGLAGKLVNLDRNTEQIFPVEANGNWWFNAEPNTNYRAEIGFYAAGRPFIRLIFSNTIETPRSAPSPNTDYAEYFAVTPNQFAEVLDSAGFSQDAFDVYVAGDFPEFADEATQLAFTQLSGNDNADFSGISLYELRYVLFALASGIKLAELRETISENLYDFLAHLAQENADALNEEKVISALEEFFGFSPFLEETTEEFALPSVFGASLIHFPKGFHNRRISFSPGKRRLLNSRLSPLSSHNLG